MFGTSQRWAVTLSVTLCLTLASGSLAQTMPDAVPNLMLWLKADAGVEAIGGGAANPGDPVGIWRDQSGNGLDATVADEANAPTLESNDFFLPDPPPGQSSTKPGPVIRWAPDFEGFAGFRVPDARLGEGEEATYFVMFDVSQTPEAVESANRRFINFTGPSFRNYNKGFIDGGSLNPSVVGPFDGTVAYGGSIPITDRHHLGNMFWRQSSSAPDHFVDGTQDSLSLFYDPTGAGLSWSLDAVANLQIGVNPNLIGDIAELIIYNRAISESERTGVTDYFTDKYNLLAPFIPDPGDFNADTNIDELDFDVLRMNFLQSGGEFSGDMNGDAFVDLLDWIEFRKVFNAQVSGSSAIPEPGGMALFVLGGGALMLIARHRRLAVTLAVTFCFTLGSGALAQNMPDDVPDLLVWFKADAGVELNGGGTANQTDPVGVWRDQSGNGFDALMLDEVRAPTLETNTTLGDVPVVHWDGTNGIGFSVPGASLAQGQESTYLVVFESANDTVNRRLIDFTGGPGEFRNYSKGSAASADPSILSPFDGTRAYAGAIPINGGVPHLGVLRSSQGDADHFVNGVLDTFTVVYPAGGTEGWELEAVNALSIGATAPGGSTYVGDIAELAIYSRALTDTELMNLTSNYFEPRYDFPAAGDFNQDGAVNNVDFDIQGMNFFESGGFAEGDLTGDGFVDLLDWIELRPLLNATGGLSAAVPEPGGIALLILGGQMLVVVRRRAQHRPRLKIGRQSGRRQLRQNLAVAIAAVIVALSGSRDARAFDFFWDAPSGSWNEAGNWTSTIGSFVPNGNFADDALIENGGTAQLIAEAAEFPVRNLGITGGVLDIQSGGALDVLQTLTVENDGQIQLSGDATFTVGGNASNSVRITGPNVTYSVGGNYATSNLIADITGPSHSVVQVTGNAALSGALQVNISGVDPVAGQSWPLINAASLSGSFTSVDTSGAPALERGRQYIVTQDVANGDVALTVGNALILSVDRGTGAATMQNVVGDPVDFNGYTIRSSGGSLTPESWSSFATSGAAGPGWAEANPDSRSLAELNLTAASSLAVDDSFVLGITMAVGAAPEDEDLLFEYSTVNDEVVNGLVEYTGPANSLELAIDAETGEAVLRNRSVHVAPDITGYAITSGSASLMPGTWTSLEENADGAGPGWSEANPTAEHLAERNRDSSKLFDTGTTISLGQIFSLAGSTDLVLQYSTLGGELLTGVVTYDGFDVTPPNPADLNSDGFVDGLDLGILLGNWDQTTTLEMGELNGTPPVDGLDLGILLGAWNPAASGAAASVPEPSCMMLLASSLAVLFGSGRSASRFGL